MDQAEPAALFATTADTHRTLLLHVAAGIVGRADAEDVVQQSLLKAWTSLGQWQGGGVDGMRNWLCRVTWTVAVDQRRHDRLLVWEHIDVQPEQTPGLGAWFTDADTPEEAALRRERREEARAAVAVGLARCTPDQQRALWTVAQEVPQEAAARLLGVSYQKMKTDRLRGKRVFKGLAAATGKPRRRVGG